METVTPAKSAEMLEANVPWYREMRGYHWFVFLVAALGWLLDCFDQQLFVLARQPAMKDLLAGAPTQATIDAYGSYATSIFLMGWGLGGLIFGVLGDRIGRTKTMMMTILMYSVCTGLSALSVGFWDFAVYRFLTGMGVGGEFAVGVALVAEVMPARARPYMLGLLQSLSAVGNISAALVGMSMGKMVKLGWFESAWRPMFVIGAAPAILALVVRFWLKEPEAWQKASHKDAVARKLGSYRELFGHPTWRRHAFIGLALAFSGIVGLWGIGFFAFDLVGNVLKVRFVADVLAVKSPAERVAMLTKAYPVAEAQSLAERLPLEIATTLTQQVRATDQKSQERKDFLAAALSGDELKDVNANVGFWKGIASMMMNIGAAFGMFGFAVLAQRVGRKPTFALCFVVAAISTASVFYFLEEFHQVFWMIPIMGFCLLSLFAGYAIYFPELFPTHLRSTGTSFCYNVGRFVAAGGSILLGWLIGLYAHYEVSEGAAAPLRYAGLTMCFIFALGLFVLPFAPETKDQPLPE